MKRRPDHATFEEAHTVLKNALEELHSNVPNYNEWLRELVSPAAVGRVIEVGAGLGTFSLALLRTADHVVAVEPSELGTALFSPPGGTDGRITRVHGYAADAAHLGPFDGAIMSNVLEHIAEDEATLRELFAMLRPGGHIAVYSPAFPLLMSDFDRSIGHVRRYRRRELRAKFEQAGFEIVDARYVNLPGFFAWLIVSRVMHKRPTDTRLSRLYDRRVVPLTRWVESRVRPPFGQSVLVIGRVPLA